MIGRQALAWLAVGACTMLAVPAWAEGAPAPAGLVNPAQLAREHLARRIIARPELQASLRRTAAAYAADPAMRIPGAKANRDRAARAIALAAVYYAIGLALDPGQPQLFWCCKAPQKLGRLGVGGSGYGIDNPDNVYRMTHVDGGSRYVIRGQMRSDRPAQLHLEVRDAIPGTTAMNAEGGTQLATLRDDALQIGADGRFVITIDSDPANGRPNHLQVPASGVHHVIVRDLLTDWEHQLPIPLTIERVGGPDLPRRSEAELAHSAAVLLDRIAPFWLDYDNRFIFSRPVNTLAPARLRPGGRGISASGHFALGRAELLLITVDPLGAASFGIQLTDPWGVAYDYIGRTSSLNQRQARANPDGTLTVAIGQQDPGFANWLDPSGQAGGIVTLRWQGLPATADPTRAIRAVEVVTRDTLRGRWPDPGLWLAPGQRAAQRAARRQSHEHRKAVPLG